MISIFTIPCFNRSDSVVGPPLDALLLFPLLPPPSIEIAERRWVVPEEEEEEEEEADAAEDRRSIKVSDPEVDDKMA